MKLATACRFSVNQKKLTQDFIRTATHLDQALETIFSQATLAKLASNQWLVELAYVGEQTNEPLIAQLYSRYQVTTNILYGNVEFLQNTPIGSLIVIPGELHQRQQALRHLQQQGVSVQVLQEAEVAPLATEASA